MNTVSPSDFESHVFDVLGSVMVISYRSLAVMLSDASDGNPSPGMTLGYWKAMGVADNVWREVRTTNKDAIHLNEGILNS